MTDHPPLLALLGHLARTALHAQPSGRAVRIVEVQVAAERLHLLVEGRVPGGLGQVRRWVEVTVEAGDAAHTVLRWHVAGAAGVERLLERGMALLPEDAVAALARRLLGEGVRVEGTRVEIRHREWLAGLRRRRGGQG